MTAQLLSNELSTIFQDSKRKNQELRNAAEKSLGELKALPQTSEAQLSADKLLAAAFEVCFSLYSSKTAVVSNTAAAALQQLVASTFEKVALEDGSLDDEGTVAEVHTDDGVIKVRGGASDAYRLLNDICLMTEGQRPTFLAAGSLSQNFGFELIESAITNYADTVMGHPEQIHVLRLQLMPLILRILSDKISFATTVRVMRLLQLIISKLLFALAPECEIALNLLNRTIETDASPLWKRALAMEVFRDLQADPTLIRSIYAHYDEDDTRKAVVRDHLASLVRLASEKPNIIGLGQQSSMSARPKEDWADQVALQAGGIVGSIGAAINLSESEGPGISTRWGIPRTPLLELLDKSEPPSLPSTYLYALAVTCISNFSDGLGKFLLPFTSPKENKPKKKDHDPNEIVGDNAEASAGVKLSQKRRSFRAKKLPVNPLNLEDHVLYPQIRTSAHMVEHCWPALLAVSSTFLNATLDSDFYHALIRSFQKFTQVAGLLGLSTPRDAFLTTLAKHSVPIRRNINLMIRAGLDHNPQPDSNENSDLDSSPTPSKRSSFDPGSIAMSPRNLLCLRALLNLGIALGPLLQKSWSIVLETLQQAEFMLPRSSKGRSGIARQPSQGIPSHVVTEQDQNGEDFGVEVVAAETAAFRMIESSSELPDDAFLDVVKCLDGLMRYSTSQDGLIEDSRDVLLSPQTPNKKHQRLPSISTAKDETTDLQGNVFVLDKLEQLIQCNTSRLISIQSSDCLDQLVEQIEIVVVSHAANSSVRIKAAEILNNLIVSIAISKEPPSEEQDTLRRRMFSAILDSISALYAKVRQQSKDSQNCDVEVHRTLLEAVRSILEQCGDSLQGGWDTVFAIITSTFDRPTKIDENISLSKFRSKSPKLVRSSYGSLQLICSDYLNNVPLPCLSMLLDALYMFSSQSQDLNISLTTTTFFANVSGFLRHQSEQLKFDETLSGCALHTMFRIFNDCGDDLSSSAWRTCFNTIIRQILTVNQEQYEQCSPLADAKATEYSSKVEWNQTAVVLVDGIASIISNNFSTMKDEPSFSETWRELLQCLRLFLARGVLELSKAVFAGLTSILEEIEDTQTVSTDSLEEAWKIWLHNNPAFHSGSSGDPPRNQDALLSYLRCLSQVLRLKEPETRTKNADAVMTELQSCVVNASVEAYTSDIERTTPVQQGVLENLKMIPASSPAVLLRIVLFLAFLVRLPYEKDKIKPSEQTHLAVSKAAVTMLQRLVINSTANMGSTFELATLALDALAEPIQLKYSWYVSEKASSIWQTATIAVLEIVETCMPNFLEMEASDGTIEAFWTQIVRIIGGVVTADCESCKTPLEIPEDQEFDIDAFHRLQKLAIPALGSPNIPDSIREHYARTISEKSGIHEPHPDDLARPDQQLLDGLQNKHIGRTYDAPATPRVKMSYVLLDELFSLVAASDSSSERARLAQATAPYLILRAGLMLKAYVLDHPLRGRAPQPTSQEDEMLYVLKKLVELECNPSAMAGAIEMGVKSQHKKHLYRLYPFVTRAMKVAFRDEEMLKALGEVLDAVGDDFGV
ncbi:MAG: hypothetical protein Q9195_009408 [Heterodermia aff. obscurata]